MTGSSLSAAEEARREQVPPGPAMPTQPGLAQPTSALEEAEDLLKHGQFEQAASQFQRIVDANGELAAYIGLVRSRVEFADYSEAEDVLRKAAGRWPADPRVHAQLGFLLDDLGRHSDASREFVQAEPGYQQLARTTMDPEVVQLYARVLTGLGRQADAKKEFSRAKTLYEAAGALQADDPDVLSGFAFVLDELDQHAEAVAVYNKVIARRPSYIALFNKAVVLDNMGDYVKAETAYRDALERFPDDPDCNAGLGNVLGKLGRYIEAESYCREALNKEKANSDALAGLGFALQHLGREQEAEEAYRASLSVAPDAPETLSNLASLLNDRDRPEDAQPLILRALNDKRTWQSVGTLAAIEVKLADKFRDDQLYEDVIDHVKEAFTMLPTDLKDRERDGAARLHVHLASAQVSLGNYSSAKAALQQAVKTAPPNSVVGLKAARNLRRLHDSLRRTVRIPPVLTWLVSAGALIGILYGLFVQQLRLDSTGFVGFVLGMLFVIFAAFSLPAITRLKIGPAEFEKASGIPTLPPLEKS